MTSRFQPSRLTTPVLLLLAVAAVSYGLNPAPWHHLSIAIEATFTVSLLAIFAMIALLRNKMYLRIDERGLEIQYAVGAPRVYTWNDIEGASIFKIRFLRIPMASSIHLRLRPGLRSANPISRAASAINGANASFPAFFDETAEEIIEKINFYKRESLNSVNPQYPKAG